jgi:3-methyladenine DNA glycosylase AlkD
MTNGGDENADRRLLAALSAFSDMERAQREKRYQKSKWEHWGVSLPKMDAAIRDTLGSAGEEALLRLSERLWREPVWDLKIVAGRILALDRVAPNECVWRYVAERMGDLDGWAVADNLASVGSRCLLADPRRLDVVESWVESPHLWTRRASLVFTLPWTKAGRDPERMLAWAARLSSDPQWFIQKAIGWWLRELGKRDPDRVRRFLAAHGGALKSVARNEATKHLDRGEPHSP